MNKYAQLTLYDLVMTPKKTHNSKNIQNKILFLSILLICFIVASIILIGLIVYYKKTNTILSNQNQSLVSQIDHLQLSANTEEQLNKQIEELTKDNQALKINQSQQQQLQQQLSNTQLHHTLTQKESLIKSSDLSFIDLLFPFKNVKLIPVYQATIDGDLIQNFKNSLEGISSLLFVIETTKGLRIGGFMSKICDLYSNSIETENDTKAFLFSLTEKEVYRVQNAIKARRCNEEYLIAFHNDLMIRDNCFEINSSSSFPDNYNNESKDEKPFALTNGVGVFYVKDIEVFRVNLK